ncbi:MAG: HEPN domain-containing protein [Oscillospiraceae bacterium]|nr:HEPN domain-containing protein [Oscillospiraceae bacterium]
MLLDKVEYWLNSCDDDIRVAKSMLKAGHFLWTAFLCNLTTEKALKAVVANVTNETPPKIHNLKRLAVMGCIFESLSEKQLAFFDSIDQYQIEARYPEYKERAQKSLSLDKCRRILKETEEFLCWIKQGLQK